MLQRQRGVLEAMARIREVVLTHQQHAMAEQRSLEEAQQANLTEFPSEINGYQEKSDGSGGFAGPDNKKPRRGVSSFDFMLAILTKCSSSETPLQDGATVAIEPKRQNGGEARTVHERSVTLVDFVSLTEEPSHSMSLTQTS